MKEKKRVKSWILSIFSLALTSFFFFSCASHKVLEQKPEPILGQWKTHQNIILSVHQLAVDELVAEISSAPGFFSMDIGAGAMIVRDIKRQSPGIYTGLFSMPGNEKPIKVHLSLINRNTIVVDTGDSRAKGNKMLWERITNIPNSKP
jgi:hypothetical protein